MNSRARRVQRRAAERRQAEGERRRLLSLQLSFRVRKKRRR